jgi:4-carboxymuconolactone decarboxylase
VRSEVSLMSRLERRAPDRLNSDEHALYASIALGPRAQGPQHFALTAEDGSLNGPFNAMLLAPALGTALQALGSAVRFGTALSDRVRESAILLVAAHWGSAFERASHEPVGTAAGLSREELTALASSAVPTSANADERACLELVLAMLAGDISDADWTSWASAAGERAVFELSTLVGYYGLLALQLRVFRAEPDVHEQPGD